MSATKNLKSYTQDIGINLAELSKKTGIEYNVIYASLGDGQRNRELRADEFLNICTVLKVNPMDFMDKRKADREEAS